VNAPSKLGLVQPILGVAPNDGFGTPVLYCASHGDELTRKQVGEFIGETYNQSAETLAVENTGVWSEDSKTHDAG
jgi:hypothetical protein